MASSWKLSVYLSLPRLIACSSRSHLAGSADKPDTAGGRHWTLVLSDTNNTNTYLLNLSFDLEPGQCECDIDCDGYFMRMIIKICKIYNGIPRSTVSQTPMHHPTTTQ